MFTASGKSAAASSANYIEDVFSTYLYTGNGSTQTITNGIDLAGKGGMVWLKARSAISYNLVTDTVRGAGQALRTESTAANESVAGRSFYSTGFDVNGSNNNYGNGTGTTYASWTFREQPKFFDVVTYTGDGTTNRTVAHSLGSIPGCIIIKRTDSTSDWLVAVLSSGTSYFWGGKLNSTVAFQSGSSPFNYGSSMSSTQFNTYISNSVTDTNTNGASYVAYLFAHNAGGFGLTGTDNVISCGSFTCDGTGAATVNLGYEPQFILTKSLSFVSRWVLADTFRGLLASANCNMLVPNTAEAESPEAAARITSTGFTFLNGNYASQTGIYIAIRRGPMKTPTSGTSVFSPVTTTGVQTTGFPVDSFIGFSSRTAQQTFDPNTRSRLIGAPYLVTSSTAAETGTTSVGFDTNNGLTYSWPSGGVNWYFQRAPGFFDVVCYTGNDVVGRNISHNLAAIPELIIVKLRSGSASQDWAVYTAPTGNTKYMRLNGTLAATVGSAWWNNTTPTSSVFTVGNEDVVNNTGWTYIAYLFATLAGVSKVGSYTGTGALQTVNCGFAAGARFVLIKRTDATGDWYVWDSARGITSGNDPYLLLNSTAAEVTGTNYVDTTAVGFQVTAAAPAGINAVGGSFVFLAIA